MEKKKYWFALYSNTFLWTKGEEGVIYNANNGAKVKFDNTGAIAVITSILQKMESLYCTSLSDETLEDVKLDAWVQEIMAIDAGILVLQNGINQRPLTLMPELKVQDDVDYYRWEHKQGIDGNIMENLHGITFFINGSQFGNNLYSKQILFPRTGMEVLDREMICRFAEDGSMASFLSEIVLVGNPFVYPNIFSLIEKLQRICSVKVCVTLEDTVKNLKMASYLAEKVNLDICVSHYSLLCSLPHEDWINKCQLTYLVFSESSYKMAIHHMEKSTAHNKCVLPVYTGDNYDFFAEMVFITEEDIQNMILSKRDVFVRQTLNISDFGRLYVMPDGKIYASPNKEPVGTIGGSLHSIVYRELTEGSSWLRIRQEAPCCDCIYQWFCPSPSHYEQVLNKPNLCTLKR